MIVDVRKNVSADNTPSASDFAESAGIFDSIRSISLKISEVLLSFLTRSFSSFIKKLNVRTGLNSENLLALSAVSGCCTARSWTRTG